MATRRATRLYDAFLAPVGIGVAQFGVLNAAIAADGRTVTELAKALDMDRSTLTRNLGPLVRTGHLKIERGTDRRSRSIRITSEGRATLARAWPLWRAAQKMIQEHLGHVTTERLHDLLAAAIERIPAGPDATPGKRGGVKP
jgi:DNA-binding MarR family transcriptional regulator